MTRRRRVNPARRAELRDMAAGVALILGSAAFLIAWVAWTYHLDQLHRGFH